MISNELIDVMYEHSNKEYGSLDENANMAQKNLLDVVGKLNPDDAHDVLLAVHELGKATDKMMYTRGFKSGARLMSEVYRKEE